MTAPYLGVALTNEGDGNYNLLLGDLFELTLSYDADDDRWYLWEVRSQRALPEGRSESISYEGDRTSGEPMPHSALTDALEAMRAEVGR